MRIIKNFFSFYNDTLEKKLRTKRLLVRSRKFSSNRIYLSKGEFKHNNNSVLVNLYIFNRQKYNYLLKLKNIYLKKFLTKKINKSIIRLLKLIYKKGLDSIKQVNKDKYLLIRALNVVEKNKNYKVNSFKSISNYTVLFYKKVLKLTMRKVRLYFLYKQLIYLNKSKLNYTYLRVLKKHLENLYNKNVEFNMINLKRFYLNSDILSESLKLKLTRNRKDLHQIFDKLKDKVKIHKKKLFLSNNPPIKNKLSNIIFLKRIVFDNLKYKHVTGFRLEARGRISRRFTAGRSIHKLKYKGNLLGLDSSYRGLSSVILKGNLKSNIQYTKLKSKTRIGSFGIKG